MANVTMLQPPSNHKNGALHIEGLTETEYDALQAALLGACLIRQENGRIKRYESYEKVKIIIDPDMQYHYTEPPKKYKQLQL